MKHLETLDEYYEAIKEDCLVVIDFYAQWCRPCKVLAPKYEAIAEEYSDIKCYKVDIDESTDIMEYYHETR